MRALTIVGYTYKAEMWSPLGLQEVLRKEGIAFADPEELDTEGVLDGLAEARGLDRETEESYDSDDFPKPVYAWSVVPWEKCFRGESGLQGESTYESVRDILS